MSARVNARVEEADILRLDWLAERLRTQRSTVLRLAIRELYRVEMRRERQRVPIDAAPKPD